MTMTSVGRNGAAPQPATKIAIVSGRVSTDEQAEKGYSLPEQEKKGVAFCASEKLSLLEVILDDHTGRRLSRPGLNRVSELAQARAFHVLVCPRTDRLARKNHLRRSYEDWLEKKGIEVRADPVRLKELFRLFLEIHLGEGREPDIRPRVPFMADNGCSLFTQ